MTSAEFKKGIGAALRSIGFVLGGKIYTRSSSEVKTLVDLQKSQYANQWFINVGFWLYALDANAPDRVEKAHMYFRLERLLPALREEVLTAGALDDPEQEAAYSRLLTRMAHEIDDMLREHETLSGLRAAQRQGGLVHGLVRKEARDLLAQASR